VLRFLPAAFAPFTALDARLRLDIQPAVTQVPRACENCRVKATPAAPPPGWRRRPTRKVMVGSVALGGDEPIRIQSMTTTDTGDWEATALQTQALAEAGCEIVRVTVP